MGLTKADLSVWMAAMWAASLAEKTAVLMAVETVG